VNDVIGGAWPLCNRQGLIEPRCTDGGFDPVILRVVTLAGIALVGVDAFEYHHHLLGLVIIQVITPFLFDRHCNLIVSGHKFFPDTIFQRTPDGSKNPYAINRSHGIRIDDRKREGKMTAGGSLLKRIEFSR